MSLKRTRKKNGGRSPHVEMQAMTNIRTTRKAWPACAAPGRAALALLAAVLGLAGAGAAPAADVALKVMSLNILEDTGTPASSSNAWIRTSGACRRDRVVRVIVDQAPDIAGLQEAETNQVADITGTNALAAYAWFGAGRTDGLHAGQHEFILYRTNRFVRQDSGVFWLSLTPDVPGSQYPTSALPRIAVWVRLLDRWSGRPYLVMDTHWDYASAAARLYSAQLIRTRLTALASNSCIVLTGDLNMFPTEAAYGALLGTNDLQSLQIRDSYRQAIPVEVANESTKNNFNNTVAGKRSDFVFHAGAFTATTAAIVRTTYDGGCYPSDHYPVTANLSVAALPPALLSAAAGPAEFALAWASVSGLPYRVSASPDLVAWQDCFPEAGNCLATGAESRCSLPLTGGVARAFYRVECRPQE